jgi:hypothetical protein
MATMHMRLATSCVIGLLATIDNAMKHWNGYFHGRHYPSSSGIVIEDWGNIMGVRTAISILLHCAAPKLADFQTRVQQTSDYSMHNS